MEGLTHKMDDQKLSRPIQTWLVVVLAIMVVLLGVSLAEDNGKNLGNKNTIPDDAYTPQPPLHEINYDLMLEEAKKTCYEKMQSKPYPTDGQLYCNRTWDGWGCWDDTPAGEVAQIHCPDYLEGFNPRQYATKNCTLKGTWWIHPNTKNFWADYTTCVQGFAGVNTTQPSRTQPAVVYKEEMNKKMMMMKEAQKCHEKLLSKPYPTDGRLYCHRTWDGWGCWDDTPAGEVARTNCPNFMEGFDPRLFAYKICTPNGTWWVHPETNRTWSNYTTCVDGTGLQTDKAVLTVFVAGYSVSMIAMVISLIIFFAFKQLNCDRITLHKNLFISYVLNGLTWILFYTFVASDPVVLGRNPLWCRVMHIFTSYFTVCNFFWMFNEGLYLHTIIVVAFTLGKKLLIACHVIGWILPLFPVILYTLLRGLSADDHQTIGCWIHETDLHWINAAPIVASLVLNAIFLCNIIRMLITKLRAVNSPDANQTKKAVRATIILVPLLGLQYIIIPFRPAPQSTEEQIYLIVAAILVSFQGLFVALIFCFFNGEVISVLKRKWGQHQLMRGRTLGKSTNSTMLSMGHDHNMTVGGDKKPICDPTSPCLEKNSSNGKAKNRHKFYRFLRHKRADDTLCCSSV